MMTRVPITLDVHLRFAAQVCCATSMTPASATPAMKAPTATPTPSTAKPSARVLRGTWGRPATRTWTSARWVSTGAELAQAAEEQLGKAPVQPGACMQLGACPVSRACVLQEPTLASTQGNASTPRGPSSASACRATRALAARSTSTSASPTPARTMPPAWTRSGSSSASACPVGGRPRRPLPRF